MAHSNEEKGIVQVLLKRLVDQRLPRLLEMKTRVDSGELLTDFDIEFLEGALRDAGQSRSHVVQFPEYKEVVGKLAHLYEEITAKALENQQAEKP